MDKVENKEDKEKCFNRALCIVNTNKDSNIHKDTNSFNRALCIVNEIEKYRFETILKVLIEHYVLLILCIFHYLQQILKF